MDPDNEVLFELLPLIRQYKSGRIHRFNTDTVPAGVDLATGVTTKDVVINASATLSIRLHLPSLNSATNVTKLPVVIYFHGGAFLVGSAFSPTCHNYLNTLVSEANAIAVSVEYRLAPENPLPTAYEDSWFAVKWVLSHIHGEGSEEWLNEHGDFSRVFFVGCSAGANIAHHITLRAGTDGVSAGVKVEGMVLIHPYFHGAEAIGNESSTQDRDKEVELWKFVCPGTLGLDDPWVNPFGHGATSLEVLACERVLVAVAEKDWLRDRGKMYYEELKKSGWSGVADLLESEGEGHTFHMFNMKGERAVEMMARVVEFLNCK